MKELHKVLEWRTSDMHRTNNIEPTARMMRGWLNTPDHKTQEPGTKQLDEMRKQEEEEEVL